MQLVRNREREAFAVLRIVLQILQFRLRNVQGLPGDYGFFLRLVVLEFAVIHSKAELIRPAEQIRLRKTKSDVTLQRANIALHAQRFSKTQEVIGAVIQ